MGDNAMNDDHLKRFRKEPPPAFAKALYKKISQQAQVAPSLPDSAPDGRHRQRVDTHEEDTDMNGSTYSAVLPLPGRREHRLQGYLVAAIAAIVVVGFSVVLLGNVLGTSMLGVVVDKATLFERYIENVWNEGNLDGVSLLLTDDHIHHDANLAEAITGLEAVSQYIAQYREGIPGLTLTVDQLTTDGDRITADLTATADEMTTTISMSSRFTDDKLAEVWFNASDLLAVLSLTDTVAAQDAVDPDAVAQIWLDIWNKRDFTPEQLEAFLSPQIQIHQHTRFSGPIWTRFGIAQLTQMLQRRDNAMPDFQYTLGEVTSISDDVVMVTVTGAGTVVDVNIAATTEENTILRLEDDKIVEAWILYPPGYVTQPNEIIDGGSITIGGDWKQGTLEPGQRVRYTLEIAAMEDPFDLILSATYDSILRVYDENGLLLHRMADSLGYDHSEFLRDLKFESGTIVFIEVGAYLDYEAGDYTLRAR
jgi:predicted ester cyclase